MKTSFVIGADLRDAQGKGASRRLRHKGKVPGCILYGGKTEPRALTLDQQNLLTHDRQRALLLVDRADQGG